MRKTLAASAMALAAGATCLLPAAVLAGHACEPRATSVASLERGLALATRTQQALEAQYAQRGTQVVVLARAGQDLTRYGLQYSHLGLALRTTDAEGQPAWRVVHKLNQCGTAEAAVFRQGLGPFFLDNLWRHEAAWLTPAPQVQQRLLALLQDERAAVRMHHKAYSMVSHPWSQRYQQSNQWAIETLALAMEPALADRAAAQAWLRAAGYQPTVLHLGALTRLGGRMTAANVAFDDHPDGDRFADRIATVTVDSVFDWLQRAGLAEGPVAVLR